MIFDYSVQKTFEQSIDVVDIGNMCLECVNPDGLCYYIMTKTIFGKTAILKIGPILPDCPNASPSLLLDYHRIDYKEKTICKEVDKFINDAFKKIDTITEINIEEFWKLLPNIQELFEAE